MPENAIIVMIEDDKDFRSSQQMVFERLAKFTVKATASTFEEAKDLIPKLGDMGVQVVTLDRQLVEEGVNCEGDQLARMIRSKWPHIVLIGLSSQEFPEKLVDYDAGKGSSNDELFNYIKNLP